MNISVIGGDLRQLTLAKLLEADGYNVITAGFDKGPGENSIDGIWDSEIIILPIPASHDSKNVNAPYSKMQLAIDFDSLSKCRLLLGGNISGELAKKLDEKNIKYIDYLKRDELMIKNAIPTAEGALEIALSETPTTIHSSNCLVVGYGKIGKILSGILKSLGANVSVSARKCSDLAWIAANGYRPIHNSDLKNEIDGFDVIFNTVPAMILDKTVLENVSAESLIIDLASKPGGVDFATAKDLGLKVIWSLGLPGKVAPITSGEIIKETVINILEETEV